jgi:hypothetical protein
MSPLKSLPLPQKIFLALVALGLLLAIATQFLSPAEEEHVTRGAHIDNYIRNEIDGWEARDLPVGETEFVASAVERILKYDDVLYRTFQRGNVNIGVFISYWGRGKSSVREVSAHTPDRCWTTSGWQVVSIDNQVPMDFHTFQLMPAEQRVFTFHGTPMYVKFWHIVGGEPFFSGSRFNAVPNPLTFVQDFFQEMQVGRQEQYFVRITSSVPFSEIEYDPAYLAIIEDLRNLGLEWSPRAESAARL